jgi:hypothetical protein
VAAPNRGGIHLQTPGVRNAIYDRQALREFLLALQSGDILVEAEGRTVPAEFWRSDAWSFEFNGERLLSPKNNVYTVECDAPHLVVPQATAKSLSNSAQPSEEVAQTSQWGNDHKSPAQTTPQSGAPSSADQPGRKPGVSGKARILQLRDAILADTQKRPAFKHGWKAELARLIHEQLKTEGHNYQFESVTKTLRVHKTTYPQTG